MYHRVEVRYPEETVGIYEAVFRDCPKEDPRRGNKPDGSWLARVGEAYPGGVSYWTEEGWRVYQESGLFAWHTSVVRGEVVVLELAHEPEDVVYRDEYQVIAQQKDTHEASPS